MTTHFGTFAVWLPVGALIVAFTFIVFETWVAPFWFPKTVFEIGDGVRRSALLAKYREWVGIGVGLALATSLIGSFLYAAFT